MPSTVELIADCRDVPHGSFTDPRKILDVANEVVGPLDFQSSKAPATSHVMYIFGLFSEGYLVISTDNEANTIAITIIAQDEQRARDIFNHIKQNVSLGRVEMRVISRFA